MKIGVEVSVICEAEGYPVPALSWKHLNSANEVPYYENKLHIISATPKNAGNYECTATNSEGDVLSKVIALSVIGKNETNRNIAPRVVR